MMDTPLWLIILVCVLAGSASFTGVVMTARQYGQGRTWLGFKRMFSRHYVPPEVMSTNTERALAGLFMHLDREYPDGWRLTVTRPARSHRYIVLKTAILDSRPPHQYDVDEEVWVSPDDLERFVEEVVKEPLEERDRA